MLQHAVKFEKTAGKTRKFVNQQCDGCGVLFWRRADAAKSIKIYCSTSCTSVKTCIACGVTISSRGRTVCKSCVGRVYRKEHNNELKLKASRYFQENKESIRIKNLHYRSMHLVEYAKRSKAYRHAHLAQVRKSENLYRSKPVNRNAKNAATRLAYSNNVAERRASLKKWRKCNPDKFAAQWARRRARVSTAHGSLTGREWTSIKKRQRSRCIDCGAKTKLTIGHLVPISLGGSHLALNIAGQCGKCNSKQGVRIHRLAFPSLFDRANVLAEPF